MNNPVDNLASPPTRFSGKRMTEGPIYRPLGVYIAPGVEERYFVEIRGVVHGFKAMELHGLQFLLRALPDPDYWRLLFPRAGTKRVDVAAAMAWFIRSCREAGVYEPPEHLRPKRGRPRKTAHAD